MKYVVKGVYWGVGRWCGIENGEDVLNFIQKVKVHFRGSKAQSRWLSKP